MTYYLRSLITDEEKQAYGEDALSVMERKAREVVQPAVDYLSRQNQQLQQQLQQVKANDVYSTLDAELPTWRQTNSDPRWHAWLREVDVYSNTPRQLLLNHAFASGDASRVLALFNGFLSEHGGERAASSRAPRQQPEAPIIHTADIDRFYEDVRRGKYEGKAAQKDALEAQIIRAAREGRVR
jgi:hypothetical protein